MEGVGLVLAAEERERGQRRPDERRIIISFYYILSAYGIYVVLDVSHDSPRSIYYSIRLLI